MAAIRDFSLVLFLSTPSARRATFRDGTKILTDSISIHALREEGDECREHAGRNQCISIHALREEGDGISIKRFPALYISIHALREEGDGLLLHGGCPLCNFYPRPPRGGRQTFS